MRKIYFKATGKAPTIPYMLGYILKIMFQIVFQTMFIFTILWMTLFHDRWENFRFFMTRNYSPQSVKYLCGFIMIFAFTVTTFGRVWKLSKFCQKGLFQKVWSQPLIVQNLIKCLILNFEFKRCSKNVTKYLSNIGRKFLELCEFYFTLLPTTEFLLLHRNSSRGNIFKGISILTTHLISSIPERRKLIFVFEIKKLNKFTLKAVLGFHSPSPYNKHSYTSTIVLPTACSILVG